MLSENSNRNVSLCSKACSKTPTTKRKLAIFFSGREKKGLICTTAGHSKKKTIGKSLTLFSENFENQLEPKTSHRITLQGMRQELHEPVDDFISRIKNLAVKCQFRDNAEVEDRGLDQLIWVQKTLMFKKLLLHETKH